MKAKFRGDLRVCRVEALYNFTRAGSSNQRLVLHVEDLEWSEPAALPPLAAAQEHPPLGSKDEVAKRDGGEPVSWSA